jgi:phage baseplate assembly protein gpV
MRFVIDADANLPSRIENVTLNIHRAQQVQQRAFPFTSNFQMTSTATTQTTNNFAYGAAVTFKDSGLSCYSITLSQPAPQGTLPANLNCDSVTYNSGSLAMTLPLGSQPGNVFLNTTMTVSGGPFQFAGIIAQWPLQGT